VIEEEGREARTVPKGFEDQMLSSYVGDAEI
jgi:hypothetical protein